MSDMDERLARALDDVVPQPPRELDPEPMRTAAPARRRRSLGPALAAAAIVLVAVGVGLVSHHHSTPSSAPRNGPHRPAGPTGKATPTVHTSPTASAAPQYRDAQAAQITAATVAELLAETHAPPAASLVDHSPVKALDTPMSEPGSPNLVRRTHWWTAPGTMASALHYFRAHPPSGTKVSGSGSASDHGVVTVRGITLDATDQWGMPRIYTELEIMVTVAPIPDGVGIRVDSEAIWLPQRTPAERIPADVTSVDVVVDRKESAPAVRRTLGAADARSFAALVNRQGVVLVGEMHCAVDLGWTDTLSFHSRASDVEVAAEAGGCAYTTVGPRSEHNPTLGGGWAIDRAVLRALGLPPNYGR